MFTEKEIHLDTSAFPKKAVIYENPDIPPKACLLYFHGGGLLYGTKKDLPSLHLELLTSAGYLIVSYDYPLAPAAKLETIVADVEASIRHYTEQPSLYYRKPLPYFLWGRSAGAYLCLLAAAKNAFPTPPKGILSFYGYGFLCDDWFCTPSPYYCTLPEVPSSCLDIIKDEIITEGDLNTRYSLYVYARQSGQWKSLIYEGRDKTFYLDYSLRTCDRLPCPLFCAHSTGDTDVPYAEFLELCRKYRAQRFVVSRSLHDFDRDESDPAARKLLESTISFMEQSLQ